MAAHIVDTETMAATWIGSPRISFSQDLIQQKDQEDRANGFSFLNHGSPVNSDFDFCVSGDECVQAGQLSNTADLLFSDGKILPIPIPIPIPIETKHYPPTASTILDKTRNKSTVITDGEEQHDKSAKTAFWKFGRSSSLNCGGGGNMSTILCSSLTLLSRSKSTGSNSNLSSSSKQQQQQKKNNGQRSSVASSSLSRGKLPKMNNGAPSSSTTTSYHGYYGKNGVRITPILNVPYMPKGISGFRHFLSRGKNNNSRKKHMLNC